MKPMKTNATIAMLFLGAMIAQAESPFVAVTTNSGPKSFQPTDII